jgi:hypothetical protein
METIICIIRSTATKKAETPFGKRHHSDIALCHKISKGAKSCANSCGTATSLTPERYAKLDFEENQET